MLITILTFVTAVFCGSSDSLNAEYRASEKQELIDYLTGNDEREWIETAHIVFLGNKEKCKEGKSYVFNRTGTVKIVECIDNLYNEKIESWKLFQVDKYDWKIQIGDQEYFFVKRIQKAKESIVLRIKSKSKFTITKDIILYPYDEG